MARHSGLIADLADRAHMAQESIERARSIGAFKDLPAKLALAHAALKRVPLDEIRHAQELVMTHWKELQALAYLTVSQREACARHLVELHGVAIVDHSPFVEEAGRNLEVFGERAALPQAIERAALLAKDQLPAECAPGHALPGSGTTAALDSYNHAAVEQLEQDYAQETNPVFAWEALHQCRTIGQSIPDWVLQYLDQAAARMMSFAAAAEKGKFPREAEQAGKALGFGLTGRGRGSSFVDAGVWKRDRQIYLAVEKSLAKLGKLDAAYHEVQGQLGLSRTRIANGYSRVRRLATEGLSVKD